RHRRRVCHATGTRCPAALLGAAAGYRRLADQLHPPEGCRRSTGRIGGTGSSVLDRRSLNAPSPLPKRATTTRAPLRTTQGGLPVWRNAPAAIVARVLRQREQPA